MRGMKNELATKLYCQSCGTRLLWQPNNRAEVKLEANGWIYGLTLHAVCVGCKSKYSAWLYIGQTPEWWEQERADTSRSTQKYEALKKKRVKVTSHKQT